MQIKKCLKQSFLAHQMQNISYARGRVATQNYIKTKIRLEINHF